MAGVMRITSATTTGKLFGLRRKPHVRKDGVNDNCSLGARCRPLQRIIDLIPILSRPGGATYDLMCRTCRVNSKTIRRDMAALRQCGFVIDAVANQRDADGYLMPSLFFLQSGPLKPS